MAKSIFVLAKVIFTVVRLAITTLSNCNDLLRTLIYSVSCYETAFIWSFRLSCVVIAKLGNAYHVIKLCDKKVHAMCKFVIKTYKIALFVMLFF